MEQPQISDLKLSRLMLGTVQFGLPYGIGLANRSGQPSYETARSIIAAAYEGGVNCFDTAAGYGTSEEVIGQALAELGICDKVAVVTKVVHLAQDLSSARAAEEAITASVLRSLKRLRLETLPVCLFHQENDFRYAGILLKLKEKGLVRHIGASVSFRPDVCAEILGSGLVEAIQVPANVFDHRYDRAGIFSEASKSGVAVFVRSVYLKGLIFLSDEETLPELSPIIPVRRRLKILAAEAGMGLAELAVRYDLSIPGATSVLVGVDSVEQMRQNLALFSKGPLDAGLVRAIDDAVPDLPEAVITPYFWSKQ